MLHGDFGTALPWRGVVPGGDRNVSVWPAGKTFLSRPQTATGSIASAPVPHRRLQLPRVLVGGFLATVGAGIAAEIVQ